MTARKVHIRAPRHRVRRRLVVLSTVLVTLMGLVTPAGAADQSSLPVVTLAAGEGQVTATWTASLYPDGSEVDGYTVSVLGDDGYAETIRTPSSRDRTLAFVALPADRYRVLVAPGLDGREGPTGISDFVEVPWLPGPPTDVEAAATKAGVTVRWQAPSSDGRREITRYVVTPRTEAGDGPVQEVAGDARSAVFTGLTIGISYTFTVSARNAIGQGIPSAPSPAVVVQPPLLLSLAAPVGRVGLDYHGSALATLGTPPYRFEVTAGALPEGLTLDADTGAITGRPRSTGRNPLTVSATDAVGTIESASASIQVTGPVAAGDLLVTAFRQSGPAGLGDQYLELTNVSRSDLPTSGVVITAASGVEVTLGADAPVLAPSGRLLIAGPRYSAATQPTIIVPGGIGSGGVRVRFPDTGGTVADLVGPDSGFHTGNGLPPLSGEPTADFAWMRRRTPSGPTTSGDNANDFQLVSATGSDVGGRPAVRGTVTPVPPAAAPANALSSSLLDPSVPASAPPNREVTTVDGRRHLTIRRMVSNPGTAPAAPGVALRISTLSTRNGGASPFAPGPVGQVAELTVATPDSPSSTVTLAGGRQLTVTNLAPADGGTGGLYALLPLGTFENALFPGQQQPIAITFAIDRPGSFWLSWDTLIGAA